MKEEKMLKNAREKKENKRGERERKITTTNKR